MYIWAKSCALRLDSEPPKLLPTHSTNSQARVCGEGWEEGGPFWGIGLEKSQVKTAGGHETRGETRRYILGTYTTNWNIKAKTLFWFLTRLFMEKGSFSRKMIEIVESLPPIEWRQERRGRKSKFALPTQTGLRLRLSTSDPSQLFANTLNVPTKWFP